MPIYGMRARDRWARRIGVWTLTVAAAISVIGIVAALALLIVWGLSLLVL